MRVLFLLFSLLLTTLTNAQPLRVMTYNIRLDTPVDSINQWPKRMDKVFALINKYNPDILGAQEVLHHQLTDLLKNLPQYDYAGAARDDGATKGEYSPVLFRKDRFVLKEQKTFWLSETPDVPGSKSWDAAITRVATMTTLIDRKSGKELLVINTHFDHMGSLARANSASLLKKKVDEVPAKLPIIVTGDFNCERSTDPYKIIMMPSGNVLFDAKPTSNNQGTFCNFKLNSAPCTGIDYIFCSAAFNVMKYDVVYDNDGTYHPSDHLPVLVDLK